MTIKHIFETEKGIRILQYIYKNKVVIAFDIATDLKTTFAHTCKLIELFESWKLIHRRQVGRKKLIKLSKWGEMMVRKLNEVDEMMKSK